MKKLLLSLTTVTLLCVSLFAGDGKTKWDLFSDNMKLSLHRDNPGVKLAALKLIIRHHDKLTDSEHYFNVIRQFSECPYLQIRKAALIALYKLDNDKAIEFFTRQQPLEKNEDIRNKMAGIIATYNKDAELANQQVEDCYNVCKCCNYVCLTY